MNVQGSNFSTPKAQEGPGWPLMTYASEALNASAAVARRRSAKYLQSRRLLDVFTLRLHACSGTKGRFERFIRTL
eukprot:4041187-Amphidinium_carterae.1